MRTLVFVLLAGCSFPAQSLREVPIPVQAAAARHTDKSFLMYPFEDERGGEGAYLHLPDFVPLVNLFYVALTQRYPENGGLLRGAPDGKSVVATGSLPHAMPYLLGNLMRQMEVATNWAPVENIDPQRDLSKFDFVVRGKIKHTRLKVAGNAIPLGLLAILGVPYIFVDYDFEYDVILLRNGGDNAELMRKTYYWSGKKVIGLYYHWTAFYDLFVSGIQKTLPEVVRDLANALPS
jgi:hypothetical protein